MYIITVTVCYSPEGAVDDSLFFELQIYAIAAVQRLRLRYSCVTKALQGRGSFVGRVRKRLHDKVLYFFGQLGIIGNALFGHVAALPQLGVAVTEP